MRKLIVSMNISLDGFMSGPGDQLDWHLQCWTSEMGDELCSQLLKADTIILGRVTFNQMAAYWPAKSFGHHCRDEDFAYANMMNSYTKIVFSKSIQAPAWSNSKLASGDPAYEIGRLKKLPGKNLMVYGSCSLVETLIKAGLVDEYQLWLHPVVLGSGRRLFNNLLHGIAVQLLHTRTFHTGVVTLCYEQQKR